MSPLLQDIRATLAYYDIFAHPLTPEEVYTFLSADSVNPATVRQEIEHAARRGILYYRQGYVSVDPEIDSLVHRRRNMERYARRHWRIAHLMTHIIKRFPFVRCVIITGTLSKNLSAAHLDIDYFIITAPKRLWIARTFLTAFKKLFLFNSRKYFCLNYFISEDALSIDDRNIFTATEISHAKVLHNARLFHEFLAVNDWVTAFFPNWRKDALSTNSSSDHRSHLAGVLELLFPGRWGDWFDDRLMQLWKHVWQRRYPDLSEEKRCNLFRVTKSTSKAHAPDFQTRILDAYQRQLSGVRSRLEEIRV